MHQRVKEDIRVLETNATKCPSRKPSSCLSVCPAKAWMVHAHGGVFKLLENYCWYTCLNPLLKRNTGLSKIYSVLCESCSENFTWKGMFLDSLAVFQIGCQILLQDLHEFSWCLHFSGRNKKTLSLKSSYSFLCIKISTWHRAVTGVYEEAQFLMNLNHC